MRKIKAGKKGLITKYFSRAKAIRKLQLSLKDFRKLCILKGIYPRQPPNKLKKTHKTYYHLKDINFLSLDPLINRIRAQKIYLRKYKHAKAKGQIGKIKYLVKNKPKLSLSHLIRQRYPDFIDALRDLDDPLSMLALFSIFSTHKQFGLSNHKINDCNKLLKHFQLFCIKTHSLKKVFVSIKGIYYQIQIMGQKITYISPYQYPPNLPIQVDYRVMSTFLDFYMVLIKFVNYKLYNLNGLQYPPIKNDQTTYQGYEIIENQQENITDDKYQIDEEFKSKIDCTNNNLLFKNLYFYLSSQVPQQSLQFIILAMGGQVNLHKCDQTITHVITDRSGVVQDKTKQYIQPQWVYDSINFNTLLNVKQYSLENELPAHLSPFIDENDSQRHIPQRQKQLKGLLIPVEQRVYHKVKKDQYDIINEKKQKYTANQVEKQQNKQISKSIMSNKTKKLYKTMQYGRNIKKQEKKSLQKKQKQLHENIHK